MITHHPTQALLTQYVAGNLPAGLAIAITAHAELCNTCADTIKKMEASQARLWHDDDESHRVCDVSGSVAVIDAQVDSERFDAMFDAITVDELTESPMQVERKVISVCDERITLPKSLSSMTPQKWLSIGKISRARYDLNEDEWRSSLLHIQSEGEIPEHTHNGIEVTLLLDGDFEDESATYVPGDFILRDKQHVHSPRTRSGCLCYTVANDSLHFTKGISKLLNPIGTLIY